MEDLIVQLVPLGFFAMVVLIVWIGTRARQAATKARAEVQTRLIDKFSSGSELAEFLGSEGSKRLLDQLGAEQQSPQERIIKTVKRGVILAALGLGCLALMVQEKDLLIPGGILLALGLGFLIAASISYRLFKKWGLDKEGEPVPESRSVTEGQPM